MKAGVVNHHKKIRVKDGLPAQYFILRTMNISQYRDHFAKQREMTRNGEYNRLDFSTDPQKNLPTISNTPIIIKSINKNELNTVTWLFRKTNQNDDLENLKIYLSTYMFQMRNELRLYTISCELGLFCGVRGILIKIISMESKECQSSEIILAKLNLILNGCHQQLMGFGHLIQVS